MSWEWKNLSDVCHIAMGKTPSRSNKKYWDEDKTSNNVWLSIADLTNAKSKYISDSKEYVSDLGAGLFKPVAKGTLLMSFKLSIGKLAFAGTELRTNEAIVALPIKNDRQLLKAFLYYYLSYYDWDKEAGNDVKVKGKTLNKEKIKNIKIPLPSLSTQQKIVEKLDAIFAEIDRATVATESNIKNTKALFQSYLTEVFDSLDTSRLYKLDDVVTRLTNGYVGATKNIYLETGIPYLLARHVKNNVLTFDERTFISDEFNKKNKKSILKADDVLLVQSGHIGHSAVVPLKHEGHNCHAMIVITTIKEILSGEFLSLYFQSNKMKNLFEKMRTGSTIKHLNCGDVKLLMIPIPSREEQENIIAKAKDIGSHVSSVKEKILAKSVQLKLLRKAFLISAFSGELVKE